MNKPAVDFSALGETELLPLNRIQQFAAKALTQSWTTIPHVTHHDEVDITALESLREELNKKSPEAKLSPTSFLLKAVAATLQAHPKVNASLDLENMRVILKKYYNM